MTDSQRNVDRIETTAYLDKKSLVTHIVAVNLTPSKRVEFRSYKVATPHWLLDSVKAGRLLPWSNFLESSAVHQESAVRIGDGDAPGGMQTTQRSLMSMAAWKEKSNGEVSAAKTKEVGSTATVSKKGKERAVIQEDTDVVENGIAKGKKREAQRVEEQESLEERGRRLGAIATSTHSHHALFDIGTSKLPPAKAPSTAASLDLISKNQARYDSYLPTAGARSRSCLQDPEWLAEHTSQNPAYLAKYFANSRLHHLSSWKAELVLLCSDLQLNHKPPIRTGKGKGEKTIFHVDFDCFFVSVGLITRPHLRGKPVAVCHAKSEGGDSDASTSEISSCSYEARLLGVKSIMRSVISSTCIRVVDADGDIIKSRTSSRNLSRTSNYPLRIRQLQINRYGILQHSPPARRLSPGRFHRRGAHGRLIQILLARSNSRFCPSITFGNLYRYWMSSVDRDRS